MFVHMILNITITLDRNTSFAKLVVSRVGTDVRMPGALPRHLLGSVLPNNNITFMHVPLVILPSVDTCKEVLKQNRTDHAGWCADR